MSTMTPTETIYLSILEQYTGLFPDHEHQLNDKELFERHLKLYTYEELCEFRSKIIGLLVLLGEVIDIARTKGVSHFRIEWVKDLADVAKDFARTTKMIQEEALSRVN